MGPISIYISVLLLVRTELARTFDVMAHGYYPPHQLLHMSPNGTLVLKQLSCISPGSMRSCQQTCEPQGDVYPVCHCDKFCELFSDCCSEYHRCAKDSEKLEFHEIVREILPYANFIECAKSIESHVVDDFFGEYMVRRCPDAYRNPVIRHRCEVLTSEILTNEITRSQPITDVKSGVTFRNVYCAQCHYRGLDDTIPWAYDHSSCRAITPELLIWTYFELRVLEDKGFCAPNILDGITYRSCKSAIPLYKQMRDTEVMIGSCPTPNTQIETERNCKAYLDPILGLVDDRPRAFRNIHCALCNGLDANQLFCAPFNVLEPGPAKFPHVVRPGDGDRIPSLTSLIMVPATQCAPDELVDPMTGQCYQPPPCGIGFIKFKNQCTFNPVDVYAYDNPTVAKGDQLSVRLELQLAKPLTLQLHRDTSLEEKFKTAFEDSRQGMLGTGEGSITSLSMNGRIESLPIRDGHIYTLSGPLTLNFTIKITNTKRGIMVERLLESLLVYNDKVYDEFRARFRIFSRAVTPPLTCENGELISVRMNETYTELLGSLGRRNITETHLVEYDQNTDDDHPYPKVHLCNLALPKFQNCSLLNFSTELFSKSSSGLVSDFGTILSGDYFISTGLIFLCADMITAKQDLLHAKVLGYITIAGFLLSLLFLFYTLLTYCLFPTLRTTPGKMIMNLSGILFLAKISLLFSKFGGGHPVICTMIGLAQHYLWLTMFFCMNAIAIFSVRTFASKSLRSPDASKRLFRFAMLYTYGLPLMVIAVCLGFHFADAHGIYGALNVSSSCWIKSRSIFLYAFVTPFCSLLVINFILFLATTRAIHATRAATTNATTTPTQDRGQSWEISLYVRLSFLMGFTWIFGVLGVFYKSLALNYLFVMANSLTGVYLAVGFMCTSRVFDLYKNRSPNRSTPLKSPIYTVRGTDPSSGRSTDTSSPSKS